MMTDPKNILIQDYSYELPEDRIARYPLAERDASKLLVFQNGRIQEDSYRNISDYIPGKSLMLFNNTRVVEARILFRKPTGGIIEIFCLEPSPIYPDIATAMQQKEKVVWNCMIGGASKWKPGQVLLKKSGKLQLRAVYRGKNTDDFSIEFDWEPEGLSFAEVLHIAGEIPLPPYLKREPETADQERYQTVFAEPAGSVAAPTAGLHFTPAIFKKLEEKNIQLQFLTLHVGAGTFKPVKSEIIAEHEMHAEYFEIGRDTLRNILDHLDKEIIAVGTTSLRTLESIYWTGVKILKKEKDLGIQQWDAYQWPANDVTREQALSALIDYMDAQRIKKYISKTQLIIAPGYECRYATGLVTNFHQSRSTLLLLVAAFAGKEWKKIYDYALANDFRFLSYGDGCLIKRNA